MMYRAQILRGHSQTPSKWLDYFVSQALSTTAELKQLRHVTYVTSPLMLTAAQSEGHIPALWLGAEAPELHWRSLLISAQCWYGKECTCPDNYIKWQAMEGGHSTVWSDNGTVHTYIHTYLLTYMQCSQDTMRVYEEACVCTVQFEHAFVYVHACACITDTRAQWLWVLWWRLADAITCACLHIRGTAPTSSYKH